MSPGAKPEGGSPPPCPKCGGEMKWYRSDAASVGLIEHFYACTSAGHFGKSDAARSALSRCFSLAMSSSAAIRHFPSAQKLTRLGQCFARITMSSVVQHQNEVLPAALCSTTILCPALT